ncbi:MAG TPA: alpha-hydroxy acid oxidase [Solirubrobacter sp.]|nr:alpha-hydroxy acid oxidase [Solirubrobacter sp.]
MTGSSFATFGEVADAARERLEPDVWDYCAGGAGTEATLRRNRAALDALVLRPRALRDVSACRAGATFLGIELALPVMLAPVGTISLFDAGGAATCARAAERAGTAAFVGVLSVPVLDEVAAASRAPLMYQLYVRGDRAWTLEQAERAEAAGCRALCVTVDSAVDGRRERDLRNRFDRRSRQPRPNLGTAYERVDLQATLTWPDIAWLAERTALPLVLKGVTDPADARLAVEAGVRGLVVSNHGGRQLDHQRATIECLPEVLEAAGEQLDVAIDGGFERGADVVKAVALGARAVLIGKLMCFALAAGGEDALVATLERLRAEVVNTLALLGACGPDELTPDHVRPSPAPWT